MPSTVTTAPARSVAPGARDRLFYGGLAMAMALTVFAGFAPTYYLRPFIGPRPTVTGELTLTPLAHLHGALFTAWVVLFVVQTSLVAARRVAIHRRMGVAGAVLAAAMVVVGVATAIAAAGRGAAPPGLDPLAFLIVPLGDIALFAGFVTAAILARRNKELHKRLMVLAYVSIMAAAVARLPGVLPYGPLAFFGLTLLFAGAGIVYDRVSRGRVHPAYLWGAGLIAAFVPLRLMLSTTGAWRAVAGYLVR
jgi:hypothetical protein